MEVGKEILLPASPDFVWDYVQDHARRHEWDVSVARAETLGEEPLGVGGRLRLVAPPCTPWAFRWEARSVALEVPRLWTVEMANPSGLHPFHALTVSWRCREEGPGCRFTATVSYELRPGWGFLERLLVGPVVRGALDASLRNLRRQIVEGVEDVRRGRQQALRLRA